MVLEMPVDTDMAVKSSSLEGRACANTHLMTSTVLLDCGDVTQQNALVGPWEGLHALMNTKIITTSVS